MAIREFSHSFSLLVSNFSASNCCSVSKPCSFSCLCHSWLSLNLVWRWLKFCNEVSIRCDNLRAIWYGNGPFSVPWSCCHAFFSTLLLLFHFFFSLFMSKKSGFSRVFTVHCPYTSCFWTLLCFDCVCSLIDLLALYGCACTLAPSIEFTFIFLYTRWYELSISLMTCLATMFSVCGGVGQTVYLSSFSAFVH